MGTISLDRLSDCASLLLDDIVKNKSTKSQLKTKFLPKYSERTIEAALKFLEDEGHIGGRNVDNLEHYSRITGYYQKLSGWNAGKLQEFRSRKRYSTI